jgi:hypothetical protein
MHHMIKTAMAVITLALAAGCATTNDPGARNGHGPAVFDHVSSNKATYAVSDWRLIPFRATKLRSTLEPGGVVEVCGALFKGQSWRYDTNTASPVEFNLHWHQGDDVKYAAQSSFAVRQAGEFVAPAAGQYCLMWTNTSPEDTRLRGRIG